MRTSFKIIKPIVTEKSMALEHAGKYVFEVGLYETKHGIKEELKKLYNVDVVNVHSIITHGKRVRQGRTARFTTKPNKKKMMVTLKAGQKIDVVVKES